MQAAVARARLATGREPEARALLAELACEDASDIPRNLRWTGTIVEIALLCAELGDATWAKSLVELLEPVEHQHGVMPIAICYAGPVRYALARLCETFGCREDAVALYEDAHAAAGALGARPMQARIALHHGLCLAARDRRRAAPLLEESARLASELGMAVVAANARAALG